MDLYPNAKNGKIHWNFDNADIQAVDVSCTLNGSTEISEAIQLIIDNFKDFFKK